MLEIAVGVVPVLVVEVWELVRDTVYSLVPEVRVRVPPSVVLVLDTWMVCGAVAVVPVAIGSPLVSVQA